MLQFCRFGELLFQSLGQPLHLFPDGFAIVFDFFRTDVTTWGEDVIMRLDFSELYGFAEAEFVRVWL